MNIVILKDINAFNSLSREKLFGAHLAGYWSIDGTFTICKDRFYGRIGARIYEDELNEYIQRFSGDGPRVTQSEIDQKYPIIF